MDVDYRDFARAVVDCIKTQDILAPILRSQLALIKLYADNIKGFKSEDALAYCLDEIYQVQILPGIMRADKIEGYLRLAFIGAICADPRRIDEQIDRIYNPPRLYAVPESKIEEPAIPEDYHSQPALVANAL